MEKNERYVFPDKKSFGAIFLYMPCAKKLNKKYYHRRSFVDKEAF